MIKQTLSLIFGILAVSPIMACWASVSLSLQDYRHPDAAVYIAIYAAHAQAKWSDEPVKLLQFPLADGNEMTMDAELPPGRYALRAFIDLNGNGELDTGALGKPVEPFAFSRAAGAANSLRFKAAVVEVSAGDSLVLRFLHPKPAAKPAAPAPQQ